MAIRSPSDEKYFWCEGAIPRECLLYLLQGFLLEFDFVAVMGAQGGTAAPATGKPLNVVTQVILVEPKSREISLV